MKIIELTRGYRTMVDDIDYDYLKQWKWSMGNHHARRSFKVKDTHPYLHREIAKRMGIDNAEQVDHINGNPLDNCRYNLRSASHIQNTWNQKIRNDNTTGYKGVYWDKNRKKYQVYINCFGKRIRLGRHSSLKKAVKIRLEAEKKLFGKFARR